MMSRTSIAKADRHRLVEAIVRTEIGRMAETVADGVDVRAAADAIVDVADAVEGRAVAGGIADAAGRAGEDTSHGSALICTDNERKGHDLRRGFLFETGSGRMRSRFLTGLSARFGMTSLLLGRIKNQSRSRPDSNQNQRWRI